MTATDHTRVEYTEQPVSLSPQTYVRRSLWMDALRRFQRNRLAMFGLVIVLSLIFLAIFADLLAPYEYDKVFFTIRHPVLPFTNPDHPLGTDAAGRDYLTRLIYGARTSLLIGLTGPLIAFSIGVPLGAVAGYKGGKWDFCYPTPDRNRHGLAWPHLRAPVIKHFWHWNFERHPGAFDNIVDWLRPHCPRSIYRCP